MRQACGKSLRIVAWCGKQSPNGLRQAGKRQAGKRNGPRCAVASRGPGFFDLAKNVWHKPFHISDRIARGLCASIPVVRFKLSAAQQHGLQLLYTLPCAVTLLEARSHA